MKSRTDLAPETLSPPPEQVLETSRIYVCRLKEDGTYEILMCENRSRMGNRKGKDKEKLGKMEVPGGKVFSSREEQEAFLKQTPAEQDQSRLTTALKELEEETGVYINQNRFEFLSSEIVAMDGEYKNIPGVDHKKTNFFMVVLNPEEYEVLPKNWTSEQESDDQHRDICWEDFELGDFASERFRSLLAPNSCIKKRLAAEATARIETLAHKTEQRTARVLNSENTSIENAGSVLTLVGIYKKRKPGTQKISPLDMNQKNISFEAFKEAYKKHFQKELTIEEVERIKQILITYCVGHVARRTEKYATYVGSSSDYRTKVEALLKNRVETIKIPEELYLFCKKANNFRLGRRLLRSFFGFGKISQLDYFLSIQGHSEEFNKMLLAQTEVSPKTGKRLIKGLTRGKKCYLVVDSSTKTLRRMASKSTTKVENDPRAIQDVYRARFIVKSEKDIKSVITFLTSKFGSKKNKKKGQSWELEIKPEKTGTNLNADKDRKEKKLIGSFPIKTETGQTLRIPIEIQIMTQEDFDRNETGANHHAVYVALQTLVDESRPTDPIPTTTVEVIVHELANKAAVYQSYPGFGKGKTKSSLIAQAQKDICERFKRLFF